MNTMMWAQLLQNALNMQNVYNTSTVVVHCVHNNIITFELRDDVCIFGSANNAHAKVVAFGEVHLNHERGAEVVRVGLANAMKKLQKNKDKWVETQLLLKHSQ